MRPEQPEYRLTITLWSARVGLGGFALYARPTGGFGGLAREPRAKSAVRLAVSARVCRFSAYEQALAAVSALAAAAS